MSWLPLPATEKAAGLLPPALTHQR
jgi:hypothetical protein